MRQQSQSRPAPRAAEDPVVLHRVLVTRTYLALDDRTHLRPATRAAPDARIVRRSPCPVALYRRLYREVGEKWYWHDRLAWSDEQLASHLSGPGVGVWELLASDESAGFFELMRQDDGAVEIAYFGLIERFIGRGLGGFMLTGAVEAAWTMGTGRVWLHTCTLDSPNALPGYKARGFREFRTERLEVDLEQSRVTREPTLRA